MSPLRPESSRFCGGRRTASRAWARSALSASSKMVHRRSGTIVVCASSSSSTRSCSRATRSSHARSLRFARSDSASNSSRGTSDTTALSSPSVTASTAPPATPEALTGDTACAGTIPYAQSRRSLTGALHLPLEPIEPLAQLLVLLLQPPLPVAVEVLQGGVALPPVDPHLARLVDRGDDQPQLDRQQLDVEQVDLDVARDDDPLVEDALEDVGERVALLRTARKP